MREGGGKDGHPLDIASLRGQHVANMLLKALIFIHIDVVLLCLPEQSFPHLLNIFFPVSYVVLCLSEVTLPVEGTLRGSQGNADCSTCPGVHEGSGLIPHMAGGKVPKQSLQS